MKAKQFLACLAFVVSSALAFAEPKAIVAYLEGKDFTVVRSGVPKKVSDAIGYELFEGDMLQTGRKTVAEITVKDVSSRIRLAENTSFLLKKISSSGASDFELIYGRVRSKIDKLAGNQTMQIQGSGAVAGVRGTDFSYDLVVAEKRTAPTAVIACFEGAVEVTVKRAVLADRASAEALAPVPETVLVSAGSMVKVEEETVKETPKAQPISPEVKEFWAKPLESYATVQKAQAPMPAAEADTGVSDAKPPAAPPAEPEVSDAGAAALAKVQAELDAARKAIETKNGLSGAGVFMMFCSAAGATVSMVLQGGMDAQTQTVVSGITLGCAGVGAALTLAGVLASP